MHSKRNDQATHAVTHLIVACTLSAMLTESNVPWRVCTYICIYIYMRVGVYVPLVRACHLSNDRNIVLDMNEQICLSSRPFLPFPTLSKTRVYHWNVNWNDRRGREYYR